MFPTQKQFSLLQLELKNPIRQVIQVSYRAFSNDLIETNTMSTVKTIFAIKTLNIKIYTFRNENKSSLFAVQNLLRKCKKTLSISFIDYNIYFFIYKLKSKEATFQTRSSPFSPFFSCLKTKKNIVNFFS